MNTDERSEVTAWPGQPLSTTDLQRLYPTTEHPAPFRPHKPWPGLGYGYSGPNVQSPPRYFPSPTPHHSTRGSMTESELTDIYTAVRAARRNLDGTAVLFFQRNTPSVIKALEKAEAILEPHLPNATSATTPRQEDTTNEKTEHLMCQGKEGGRCLYCGAHDTDAGFTSICPGDARRQGIIQKLRTPTTTATTASRLHRKPSR